MAWNDVIPVGSRVGVVGTKGTKLPDARAIEVTPTRVLIEYWVRDLPIRRWVPKHRVTVIATATGRVSVPAATGRDPDGEPAEPRSHSLRPPTGTPE